MKLLKQFTYVLLSICITNNMHSADLHEAAKNNKVTTMMQCLAAGADVNGFDEENETPLMHAIRCGHVAAVKCLIDYGADPNYAADGEDPPIVSLSGSRFDRRTLAVKKIILNLLGGQLLPLEDLVKEDRPSTHLERMLRDGPLMAIIHKKMAELHPACMSVKIESTPEHEVVFEMPVIIEEGK